MKRRDRLLDTVFFSVPPFMYVNRRDRVVADVFSFLWHLFYGTF